MTKHTPDYNQNGLFDSPEEMQGVRSSQKDIRRPTPIEQNYVCWVDTGKGATVLDAVVMSKGAGCIKGHLNGSTEFCYFCKTWDNMLQGIYPKHRFSGAGGADTKEGWSISRGRREYAPV